MQSTGQGGMHSSQPLHSAAITVCICFAAPRMASTGQASTHLKQPMHSVSSITATSGDLRLEAMNRIERLGRHIRAAVPARRW